MVADRLTIRALAAGLISGASESDERLNDLERGIRRLIARPGGIDELSPRPDPSVDKMQMYLDVTAAWAVQSSLEANHGESPAATEMQVGFNPRPPGTEALDAFDRRFPDAPWGARERVGARIAEIMNEAMQ